MEEEVDVRALVSNDRAWKRRRRLTKEIRDLGLMVDRPKGDRD